MTDEPITEPITEEDLLSNLVPAGPDDEGVVVPPQVGDRLTSVLNMSYQNEGDITPISLRGSTLTATGGGMFERKLHLSLIHI